MKKQETKETLPFLSSQERLDAYKMIVDGCSHIYSKNKLQEDKFKNALDVLVPLTKNDPYFLARLTSYVLKNSKGKDLKVLLTFISALSSADGTPFSETSNLKKPNLRYISAAALHMLDPKLADRVARIAAMKFGVKNYLNESRHFPSTLKTAIKKYINFRENNIEIMKGIKKTGLASSMVDMYRLVHKSPTEEAAKVLRWQQKDKKIKFEKSLIDFTGLTDEEIAKKIQKEKIPALGVLANLPRTISPVVAVALLEQVTGNQAVILRKTFEDAGVLKDKEVLALYEEKIKSAKTALDRVDTLSETASEEVKKIMKMAKSESRKKDTQGLGKIFMHLDDSGSMQGVREFAIEKGSIFAECINDPKNNFSWGMFGSSGQMLPLPVEFTSDGFAHALFGMRVGGGTYCYALYPKAREFGADIDVFVTDQENTFGDLGEQIREYHRNNPTMKKPKACIVVDFGRGYTMVKDAYEENDIPVTVMKPQTLSESALVTEAIKTAMLGPVAIIDEIMNTELLKLPNYYFAI